MKEHEKYFDLTSHYYKNPPTTSIWVFREDIAVAGREKKKRGMVRRVGSDLPQRVHVHSFTSAANGNTDQSRSLGFGGKTCIVQQVGNRSGPGAV